MTFAGTLGPPNVEVVLSTSTPTALNPRGAGTSDPFFQLFLPVSLLPFILPGYVGISLVLLGA